MIAPELRHQNGLPERQTHVPPSPAAAEMPQANQVAAALQTVRSLVGGSSGRVPLGVLIATAAVVGVTAGWLAKRR